MSRVRMSDLKQYAFAHDRSWLSMGSWDGETRRGVFRSKHGFVEVFTSRHPCCRVTAIEFIHHGVSYSRRWETLFGDKTIARLARELAEEVAG